MNCVHVQWVTAVLGGADESGRHLVTKTAYRLLHTLYNLGPGKWLGPPASVPRDLPELAGPAVHLQGCFPVLPPLGLLPSCSTPALNHPGIPVHPAAAPEPNITILWNDKMPEDFKK